VTLGAVDDATVSAGAGAASNFGASPNLMAKNDPASASARSVTFIKFDAGELELASVEQAILRVFGENDGSADQVLTHVYGLVADGWNEETITWDNAPNLSAAAGAANDVSHNFVEDVGGTAAVAGHFTGTQTARELMLDVTPFVKEHPDSEITFMIAREVRFDGENVDDELAALRLASKESGVDAGPQLIMLFDEPALAGDFNADGLVDASDLAAWKPNHGRTAGARHVDGDADLDGDVDGADFLAWQQSAGDSLHGAAAAAAIVPEPGGLALATIALCAAAALRQSGW
jgi:hypothetical protein